MSEKKYSVSYDEESFRGDFGTIDEAVAEGLGSGDGVFWVGESVPPTQPEEWWNAADWLEHVSVQDEYNNEWAEDWDCSTRKQCEELEAEVREVMARWLDRHGLRPTFWKVINVVEYVVTDGVATKSREITS